MIDREPNTPKWKFRVYVLGNSKASANHLRRLRTICETHAAGDYAIEAIDAADPEQFAAVKADGVIGLPTTVRIEPTPALRIVGNFVNPAEAALELGLAPDWLAPKDARSEDIGRQLTESTRMVSGSIELLLSTYEALSQMSDSVNGITPVKTELTARTLKLFRAFCRKNAPEALGAELERQLDKSDVSGVLDKEAIALIRGLLYRFNQPGAQ